jgi:glycosyltransferase involved in cell wall biosynthesis
MPWIVCQIGAREHYAIPRAVHAQGQLHLLVTDAWRIGGRFHSDLRGAAVRADNLGFLTGRITHRLHASAGWNRILADNHRFQATALRQLREVPDASYPITLFAYSYAARDLLAYARTRGWRTVLGQIDPGPQEERIVATLSADHPQWSGGWSPAPPSYWAEWREETQLADAIVVNSEWSRQCLLQEGLPAAKLHVIPLAYEGTTQSHQQSEIKNQKCLRVLFLGQANVRKGIHDLVAAARLLEKEPFQFDIVGPHPPLPPGLPANVRFHGPVPRAGASAWYARADVFVLPTHSDGFALTQLEALAHGLPVIATPCCGRVVEDGVNGWIVPPGHPDAMAQALREAAADSGELLRRGAQAQRASEKYSVSTLWGRLHSVCD